MQIFIRLNTSANFSDAVPPTDFELLLNPHYYVFFWKCINPATDSPWPPNYFRDLEPRKQTLTNSCWLGLFGQDAAIPWFNRLLSAHIFRCIGMNTDYNWYGAKSLVWARDSLYFENAVFKLKLSGNWCSLWSTPCWQPASLCLPSGFTITREAGRVNKITRTHTSHVYWTGFSNLWSDF